MTRLRFGVTVLLAALAALGSGRILAIDYDVALEDPKLEARYDRLANELRCLVCQNQTIADSDATLAKDLRRQVRDQLRNGQTDAQIRQYMVERYGDFVLFRPPWNSRTWLLWLAPLLLLLGGGLVVVRVILRRSRGFDESELPTLEGD